MIAEQARQAHASLSRRDPERVFLRFGSSGSDSDSDEEESRQKEEVMWMRRPEDVVIVFVQSVSVKKRDLRLEALGKRSKTMRDLDRDVSEQLRWVFRLESRRHRHSTIHVFSMVPRVWFRFRT